MIVPCHVLLTRKIGIPALVSEAEKNITESYARKNKIKCQY